MARRVDKSGKDVDKSKGKTKRRGSQGQLAYRPEMRGRGPKKGAPNAGRPPDAFRALMRSLADRAAQTMEAKKILEDPTHPLFMAAAKHVTEHGYGKPVQPVTANTKNELLIRFVDADLPADG